MTLAANPFDLLPTNLFNLFSTQGYANLQRHYMAILLRIYALAEFNRFGLAREVVLAEIVDYLKIEGTLAEVAAQADSEIPSQSGAAGESIRTHTAPLTGQQSENDYAAYLLRRLDETGWIEREQHTDYSETIVLPDYAFALLEAFRNIQEQKPHEFTGQLYTAHQLVTASQTNKDFSPSLAVTQAYENVRQVVRGLSELNHNIRRYIERATRGKDAAELLHLQFDDYAKTLGPTYHALKTSDHVSRYRQDIISQFQAWQLDGEWLDGAAEDMAMHSRLSPAQAGMEISHYLQFVVHQLESLDPLLEDIDHRHMQYLRTSLRQIRYQLVNADGSFKDRLASLAQGLASLKDEDLAELPDDAPAPRQHPVQEPDLHSYFTPPQRRAPFTPVEVVAHVLYPAELAEMHAATLQDVTQALSPGRVNRAVMSCFNGHKKLHLSELHPALLSDLHWLTTIIAYAHHPEVAYGLEMAEGEPVEVHSFRIAPFHLVKLTNGSS
ncbi:MAG TPA: Wadjet anti-phage system protein JetA family protein [Anaerolineales bacterium]|nr:Wadjet anti-phage system protein JetA family protein [Anaerolineales bacterium]